MGRTLEYPKRVHNTVNRHGSDRGTYDLEAIHTIVNNALILNVSFSPSPEDDFPTILPMIGTMASFESPSAGLNEPLDCYLHGYVSSRIMRLAAKAKEAGKPGLPVCVSASKVDGLVLASTSFSHSYNYRSAVLFGYADLVTAEDEKLFAMEAITNKVVGNRWDNVRSPPNKGEMSSTHVLRVTIESGSGKIRDKPPSDDKVDLTNDSVMNTVWTGYIPVTETLGEPVPSSYNRVKAVPDHIVEHRKNFNDAITEYSDGLVQIVKQANGA